MAEQKRLWYTHDPLFGGETGPYRDKKTAMRLAKDTGLKLKSKPNPDYKPPEKKATSKKADWKPSRRGGGGYLNVLENLNKPGGLHKKILK